MRWVVHLCLREFLTAPDPDPALLGAPGAVGTPTRGVPLAVVENGIVLEASPEAMALGVAAGDPADQAARRCPGLVRVAHDPVRAREAAAAVWDMCVRVTPFVEPDGDRAVFLSLGAGTHLTQLRSVPRVPRRGLAHSVSAPAGAVLRLVQTIFTERGYRVWAGLAPSKLVARIASSRGGFTVVRPEEVAAFMAATPVDDLWPAPEGVRAQLQRLGVATCGDLGQVPEGELWRHFGRLAPDLARWSRGEDPHPVLPLHPQRTVEARLAFPEPVADAAALGAALDRLARRLARRLAGAGEGCRWVSLLLEADDGQRREGRRRFSRPTQSPATLRAALEALARGPGRPVVALVATAGDLRPAVAPQGDLFGEAALAGPGNGRTRAPRWDRAAAVMEGLDRRYGGRTMLVAAQLPVSRRERLLELWDPLRARR